MPVPIWIMPDRLGSSVEVISSARAHLMQRMTATWTEGRAEESMLCRTVPELVELGDERSRSEVEKAEEEDDEDEDAGEVDEGVPVTQYGTVGGRVAEADMVGEVVSQEE